MYAQFSAHYIHEEMGLELGVPSHHTLDEWESGEYFNQFSKTSLLSVCSHWGSLLCHSRQCTGNTSELAYAAFSPQTHHTECRTLESVTFRL